MKLLVSISIVENGEEIIEDKLLRLDKKMLKIVNLLRVDKKC